MEEFNRNLEEFFRLMNDKQYQEEQLPFIHFSGPTGNKEIISDLLRFLSINKDYVIGIEEAEGPTFYKVGFVIKKPNNLNGGPENNEGDNNDGGTPLKPKPKAPKPVLHGIEA